MTPCELRHEEGNAEFTRDELLVLLFIYNTTELSLCALTAGWWLVRGLRTAVTEYAILKHGEARAAGGSASVDN